MADPKALHELLARDEIRRLAHRHALAADGRDLPIFGALWSRAPLVETD